MAWKTTWKTIFVPEFDSGGLSLTRDQVAARIFENAESPSTTATLAANWTGTNVTVTRETTDPLRGEGSLKVVVAGGSGNVYKAFDRALFGYPFPGHNSIRIRYVKFRATCDSGSKSFRVVFNEAADVNHYRYWEFTVEQDASVEWVVDMDPDNEEGFVAPVEGASPWNPEDIDRFGFINLADGSTYYFDDIEFIYEYSLPDVLGFPTEAPVTMGNVGSINARINGLWADVKALESRTWQYAKSGVQIAEMGQALQWSLELMADFAPPTTTEIEPGQYQIDQVRGVTTTNIVPPTAASESLGTIYASYTPLEALWDVGDLIKVTFFDGFIRSDEDPNNLLSFNATVGNDYVRVPNAYEYQVGWLVRVYDDTTPEGEYHQVLELSTPTTVVLDGPLTTTYTTADNARLTRIIRTDLDPSVFFTMLQSQAQNYKIIARGFLTDGSSATTPIDTNRAEVSGFFNGSWLMPVAGACTNQPRLIVDYDLATGTFTLDLEQPFTAAPGNVEYVILGNNSQLSPVPDSINNQTPAHVIGNKEDVPDWTHTATESSLVAFIKGVLGAIVIGEGTLTNDSATVPADTGQGVKATGYYSGSWLVPLTGNCAFQPRLIVEFATTTGIFTLDLEQPFTAAPGLVDYIILSPNSQLAPSVDSTYSDTPSHVVGNKADNPAPKPLNTASLSRYLKAVVARGMGTLQATVTTGGSTTAIEASGLAGFGDDFFNEHFYMQVIQAGGAVPESEVRKITDYVSITGIFTCDAFSVAVDPNDEILVIHESLISIGRNDADNTFDSSLVEPDDDGSVFERLEWLQTMIVIAKGTLDASSATVPADSTRVEVNSYFDGSWLMTLAGDAAYQPRLIVNYVGATGVFTLDPEQPFTAASGTVDYVVLSPKESLIPSVDSSADYTPAHVIGGKADNPAPKAIDTASLVRYTKALAARGMTILQGTVTSAVASPTSVTVDSLVGFGTDFFNDHFYMQVIKADGAAPEGRIRKISGYASATGVFSVVTFTDNVEADDEVLIIHESQLASLSPDLRIGDASGLVFSAECEGGSATTAIAVGLAGFGDDFFNTQYYLQVVYNENSHGMSPEPKIRKITDYDSITGTFTFATVTHAVESGDKILVIHEALAAPDVGEIEGRTVAQVVGNKGDEITHKVATGSSALSYLKGLVARGMLSLQGGCDSSVASTTEIYSSDLGGFLNDFFNTHFYMQVIRAGGVAPEGEVRKITDYSSGFGIFTCDAFSDVVESGDQLLVLHESQVAIGRDDANNTFDSSTVIANDDGSILERLEWLQSTAVIAKGTFTASSATVPADDTRAEAADYFNGSWLMSLTGAVALQPRLIVDFTDITGVFTLDPEHPFTAAPGAVEYVILAPIESLVPSVDASSNYTPAHVVGNKDDTADFSIEDDASLVRLLKAVYGTQVLLHSTLTDGSIGTGTAVDQNIVGTVENFYAGSWLMPVAGPVAFQPKLIVYHDAVVTFLFGDGEFTSMPGEVEYVILAPSERLVAEADSGLNWTPGQAIGNKTDGRIPKISTSASLIAYSKALLARGMTTLQGVCTTGASTTAIASSDLIGFGDDFFNTHFYMQVIKAGGAAPESEVRQITDYVSATGTFTCDAFSVNVDAADEILILHESLVAIGRDDADNTFDSSTVVADEDGSILERQEYVQEQIGLGTKPIVDDAGGSATVIADATRITEGVDYWKGALLLCSDGANEGQIRQIRVSAVGSVTVYPAFAAVSVLNDEYLIISAWRPDVFNQQASEAVSVDAIVASETDILDLSTSGFTYELNNLRIKLADPGANTVTVRLYELINDVQVVVDSFTIDTVNFGTYHSLVDMFGLQKIAGSDIQITVQASAGGPYAITAQYHYGVAPTG